MTERVIAYIDGYNLYHGMMAAGLRSSRWLDLFGLCGSLLRPDQRLDQVRYFTAPTPKSQAKAKRQSLYWDALEAHGGIVDIVKGYYLSKTVSCRACGASWKSQEEKKTDVNISLAMFEDAVDNLFDVALLVSGDSDLTPPITTVRRRYPQKRVIVATPPKRGSTELKLHADAYFTIPGRRFRSNRLPSTVVTARGVRLTAPQGWLPPGV
ncbi:MAG: NYN domain-containing protein [Acidimicrobiales bacterium]